MALRVLLADESTSIKKVMQLALQDFGVEVKAVPVGIDVLAVAKSWNPDIVFVDVLLAKKSGYEVCSELHNDPFLAKVPIVLIWSSFMDIDEKKASSCGAIRRLEKPFDAETLRGMIKDLVPSVSSNAISSYLSFPHLPDFVEKQAAPPPPPQTPPPPAQNNNRNFNQTTSYNLAPTSPPMESLPDDFNELGEVDEPEDFRQVPLPRVTPEISSPKKFQPDQRAQSAQPDAWSSGNLDRFKINIPQEDYGNFEEGFGDIEDAPIALKGANQSMTEVPLADLDEPELTEDVRPRAKPAPMSLDPVVAEQVLREQVRAVLQEIAWKIIPDIAERVVREEIQKLLKDAEKLS